MSARHPDELGAAIGRFRDLRRRFEQAIPATAVSVDGRSFEYRIAIGGAVPPPGGFVALVDGAARRLGQVVTQELVTREGPEVGASVEGESLAGQSALEVQARPGAPAYEALASSGVSSEREGLDRLVRRVRNLGVDRFGVWAREQAGTVLEDLDRDDWRCLVVDIGTLDTPTEKTLVAQAVLARLWERRLGRRPLLVVIDEAHNVCPQLPENELQFLATETAIKIAAEGRKFGLYLLVSTQRPQKVHENVVSQCDNLLLMRMNSVADVGHLTDLFSFVPPSLLGRATGFRQGEALVAGKIVATPTLVRFGARVSEEGGSDVPADWARGGA